MNGEAEKVRVIVRCRPLSSDELSHGHSNVVNADNRANTIQLLHPDQTQEPPRSFVFDAVFPPDTNQILVYNVAARPIVENVLKGYNGTIFAYGQTGTGKTFTMSGDDEKPGIIPNSFAHIFDHISKCEHDITFLVRVSFLEIYNEEIRDLLAKDGNGTQLEIKERPDVGVYVNKLSTVTVSNASQMLRIMEIGSKNRKTGATKMNSESSRSHAMFTVTIESSENGHVTQGKLQLVDLAGSERQSKTGTTGDRLKEAAKINLSLSTLGNVISALVDGKSTHIPYRNSKLTRLLQDSLGGNSKTLMIANIGPASYNYDETLSTLRYANRAKNIQNVARINEDPKDAMLRKFQEEIEMLRQMLAEEEGDGEEAAEGLSSSMEELRKARGTGEWEQKMKDMEESLERRRAQIDPTLDESERRKLAEDLLARENELKKARADHEALRSKLAQMESKLIIGGENVLEKAEHQARLLEESNRELEESKKVETTLQDRLREKEQHRETIEEKTSTLQEEAHVKTNKLKRVFHELKEVEAEISDVEAEHQREMEGLLETVRQLSKELQLQMTIIDEYIPQECLELIEQYVEWNEEIGEWQLRAIAYTGNNMRAARQTPPLAYRLDHSQAFSPYYSYKTDVPSTQSSSRPPTRSARRERSTARINALLS
ncbi:unnamed protein product, partial [Mesorhabditis belari]|uniref:Kinesin-like protein n=1 Tax=Mesorhabditis belari TaxID=2138241 RepID=A0AAF3E8Y2_9BILA